MRLTHTFARMPNSQIRNVYMNAYCANKSRSLTALNKMHNDGCTR